MVESLNASQNTQVHVKSKNLSFQNFQKAAQIGALLFMYVENKCQLQHLQTFLQENTLFWP